MEAELHVQFVKLKQIDQGFIDMNLMSALAHHTSACIASLCYFHSLFRWSIGHGTETLWQDLLSATGRSLSSSTMQIYEKIKPEFSEDKEMPE